MVSKFPNLPIFNLVANCFQGEQKCADLMNEDTKERQQRKELQEKKAKLIKAADSLAELVRKFTMDDTIAQPSQPGQTLYHPAMVETPSSTSPQENPDDFGM